LPHLNNFLKNLAQKFGRKEKIATFAVPFGRGGYKNKFIEILREI
jgi:hypothetical protein